MAETKRIKIAKLGNGQAVLFRLFFASTAAPTHYNHSCNETDNLLLWLTPTGVHYVMMRRINIAKTQ